MANLERDKSGNYLVYFRFAGRQFRRALGTKDQGIAEHGVAKVEETLMRLKRGWLEVPEGVEPGTFVVSGGTAEAERLAEAVVAPFTIEQLFNRYEADLPEGAKQASTRLTERIHRAHVTRILGAESPVESVTLAVAQKYVAKRSIETDKRRKTPIKGGTILKELKTFRYVWGWGFGLGLVGTDCPWQLGKLQLGRSDAREPFRTMAEIERRIERGGLSDEEVSRLWECLYLTGVEVKDLLAHAKARGTGRFVFPMLAFCALTGARRSELCRSRIDDFDFKNRTIHIRERKRDQSRTETMRKIDLHEELGEIMMVWFAEHPGGQHTLAQDNGGRVSVHLASDHFNRTLASHKRWKSIPGFHTLRHSFASILAAKGVDQRLIDAFMGHQTEEMRVRYQHLFPAARQRAIDLLLR